MFNEIQSVLYILRNSMIGPCQVLVLVDKSWLQCGGGRRRSIEEGITVGDEELAEYVVLANLGHAQKFNFYSSVDSYGGIR